MIGQTRSGSYLLFGVNSGVWLSFDSLREGVKVVVFHDAIDSVVQPRKNPSSEKVEFDSISSFFFSLSRSELTIKYRRDKEKVGATRLLEWDDDLTG